MVMTYINSLFDLIWSVNTRLLLLDLLDHTIKVEQAEYSAQMSVQNQANCLLIVVCLSSA